MTITTEVDVDVSVEDVAAAVKTWSERDKRQFLVDVGLATGEPVAFVPFVPFVWPKRHELAEIIERWLPDTVSKPAKWWAEDIAGAIRGMAAADYA